MEATFSGLRADILHICDIGIILDHLDDIRHKSGSFASMQADRLKAYKSISIACKNGYAIGFYDTADNLVGVLLYDVGGLWWSDKKFLFESLVLCIDPNFHGFQRKVAIPALEMLARQHKADLIVAGCFYQADPQMVMNGYYKAGYHPAMPTCMKEVKYG